MNIKIVLYIIIVPLVIWALDAVNFNNIVKKNKYRQVRILYILISVSLSYLAVNFLYDFYINSNMI